MGGSEDGGERPGALLARRTEEGMEPDDLLCSRNARPQKVLVGRAQQRATWLLLPCGKGRRSIGVWISADWCSKLASKKEKAPGTIIPFSYPFISLVTHSPWPFSLRLDKQVA